MKKGNNFTKAIAIVLSMVMILGMGSVAFASVADITPSVTPSVTPGITSSVTPKATPQTYKVVSSISEYGILKLEKEDYQVGENVVLNIKATDGFEVAGVSAYETKDVANEAIDIFNDKAVKIKDNTFVMPASDVRVLVDYTEKNEVIEAKEPTPTPTAKIDVEEKSNATNKDAATDNKVKSNTLKFITKGDAYTSINFGGKTREASKAFVDFTGGGTLDLTKLVDGKAWLYTNATGAGTLKGLTLPQGVKQTLISEETGLGGYRYLELDFSGIKENTDVVIDFTGVQITTFITGITVNEKHIFTDISQNYVGNYPSGYITEMKTAKYGDTKTWGNGFWKIARPSLDSIMSKFGMTKEETDVKVSYTSYGCDGNDIWMRCTGTTNGGTFDDLSSTSVYIECMGIDKADVSAGETASYYRFRVWANNTGGQTKEGYFEIKVTHKDVPPTEIKFEKRMYEESAVYFQTKDILGNKNTMVKPIGATFVTYKVKKAGLVEVMASIKDINPSSITDASLLAFYTSINTNVEIDSVLDEIDSLIINRPDYTAATYGSDEIGKGNPDKRCFSAISRDSTNKNGTTGYLEIEQGVLDWYITFEVKSPEGANPGWETIEAWKEEDKGKLTYFYTIFTTKGTSVRTMDGNLNIATYDKNLLIYDYPQMTNVKVRKNFVGTTLEELGLEASDVKFLISSKPDFSDAQSISLTKTKDLLSEKLKYTGQELAQLNSQIKDIEAGLSPNANKLTLVYDFINKLDKRVEIIDEIDRIKARGSEVDPVDEMRLAQNTTDFVTIIENWDVVAEKADIMEMVDLMCQTQEKAYIYGEEYYGVDIGGIWCNQVYYIKEDPNCKAVTMTGGYILNKQVYSFMPVPESDGSALYSDTKKDDVTSSEAINAYVHPYIGSETGGIINEAPPSELQLKKVSSNPAITDGNSCYSRAMAVFTVYDAKGDVAKDTSGKDVILITDGNGESQTVTIKAGTYTIKETTAPKGYLLSAEVKTVILEAGETRTVDFADVPLNDPVQLALKKVDAETGKAETQGDGTFADTEYTFKFYNGQYTKGQLAGKTPLRTWVLVTNDKGEIVFRTATKVSGDEFFIDDGQRTFPLGTVTIQESKAPKGYLVNHEVYLININEDPQKKEIVAYEIPVAPEPVIRGGVKFHKSDAETRKHETQGDGDFATTIEVVNDSANAVEVEELDINGQPTGAGVKSYAKGDVVATIKLSEAGEWISANDWLSYGKYIANEIVEPVGYLWKSKDAVTTVKFKIEVNGEIVPLTEGEAFFNDVIRLDVRGIKIKDGQADGSLNRLANIPLKFTHISTGESHIIVTDPNGEFNTLSGWKALPEGSTSGDGTNWTKHSYNTNANDRIAKDGYEYDNNAWKNGIYFGDSELVDDTKGALLYGKYRVEELPCEANKGLILLDFTFDAHLAGGVINLGTLTDDVTPPPSIGTVALSVDGSKVLKLGDEVVANDEIRYSNFKTNTKFKAKGHFVDYQSGKAVTEVSELEFTTDDKTSGVVKVPFKLNTNDIAGKTIVAMEEVYEIKDNGDEVLYTEHKDKEDKGQTLTVVEREPEPTPEPTVTPKITPTKKPTPTPAKDKPKTPTTSLSTPKTGDNAQMALWLGVSGIALIGAVGAVVYRKKKRTTVTK